MECNAASDRRDRRRALRARASRRREAETDVRSTAVKRGRRALVLLLALTGPLSMRAETLGEAWAVALAGDWTLASAQSRVAAAEAGVGAARAERWPALGIRVDALGLDSTPAFDFSGAGLPLQMPLFDGSRLFLSTATVMLPLYTSGLTRATIDAAEADLDARRLATSALAQQVKLSVAARYVGVLRAESALTAANARAVSLAAHLREVEDLYQGGSVARNDLLAAIVSLADAEQSLLQARNGLDFSRAAYNRALGRPLDAAVEVDGALPGVDPSIDTGTLEAVTELALTERDELRGLAASAGMFSARAESIAAAARPQLALTGGYVRLDNEFLNRDDYWLLGVGVRWNAFDGGRSRERANALTLESEAVRRQQKEFESMLALEVRQAWLSRAEAEQRLIVTGRAVEQAEENLRVAGDRYRNGEGTNSDVLDAEALRNLSVNNFDGARYDAALGLYQLAYAVGRL
jgi:outer membrane protein